MWPLAMHPNNKNELVACDLAHDPTELAGLNAADLRLRLFTKTENLPSGVTRLPFKSIHLSRSPMVMGHLRLVSDAKALRWGIGVAAQLENAAKARDLPDMSAIWPEVFARAVGPAPDVDEDLYGGFVSDKDHRRLLEFRTLNVAQSKSMGDARSTFDDPRLDMMVFRYRAQFPRNIDCTGSLDLAGSPAGLLVCGRRRATHRGRGDSGVGTTACPGADRRLGSTGSTRRLFESAALGCDKLVSSNSK